MPLKDSVDVTLATFPEGDDEPDAPHFPGVRLTGMCGYSHRQRAGRGIRARAGCHREGRRVPRRHPRKPKGIRQCFF